MSIYILPYKMGSQSAKLLAERLGAKRIKTKGSKYKQKARHKVINWGRSDHHHGLNYEKYHHNVLNNEDCVGTASDKLEAFLALQAAGVPTPKFTTDKEEAKAFFEDHTHVVERHLLRSNSGKGIKIKARGEELEDAPLYTGLLRKKYEYRVHVVGGETFVQRKVKRKDVEGERKQFIFNHDNGYVFAHTPEVVGEIPEGLRELGERAVDALELDFGAVDIAWYKGNGYVLEVNTAPGIEGTTLDFYVDNFKRLSGVV